MTPKPWIPRLRTACVLIGRELGVRLRRQNRRPEMALASADKARQARDRICRRGYEAK
jgi:hypothetical protein